MVARNVLKSALASGLSKELRKLFDAVEASALGMRSTYLQQREELSIYVRLYARGLGSARYMGSMGQEALFMTGRTLVIANIELQAELRGKGLLGQLVGEIQRSVPDLDVIEFECVNNDGLAASLIRQGYQLRDSNVPMGCSLYKQQIETALTAAVS